MRLSPHVHTPLPNPHGGRQLAERLGEILFDRVGSDRCILVRDLLEFEEQRQRDRRELAERFAHQRDTAKAATDGIADLL